MRDTFHYGQGGEKMEVGEGGDDEDYEREIHTLRHRRKLYLLALSVIGGSISVRQDRDPALRWI